MVMISIKYIFWIMRRDCYDVLFLNLELVHI